MAHQKFMFERSFDADAPDPIDAIAEEAKEEEEEPEIVVPTFSEEDIERTRREAFAKGKEEALREAATAIENQIVDAIKAIGAQLSQLISHQQLANSDIFRDAVNISSAITRKTFPKINIEQALPEIESVIRQILTQIIEEPRVIIYVHPNISEQLKENVKQIASEAHFEGRVIISGDDTVAEGDCKIEWSNGGAERNFDRIMSEVDAIIEENLAALNDGFIPSPDALDGAPEQAAPDSAEPVSESNLETAPTPPEAETLEPADTETSKIPESDINQADTTIGQSQHEPKTPDNPAQKTATESTSASSSSAQQTPTENTQPTGAANQPDPDTHVNASESVPETNAERIVKPATEGDQPSKNE